MRTDKQQQIIDAAKAQLEYECWFMGVCVEPLPTDEEIDADFAGCVSDLVSETMYWDAPNMGLGESEE